MCAYHNTFGASALLMPIHFQLMNASLWCCLIRSVKHAGWWATTSNIKSEQDQSNDSKILRRQHTSLLLNYLENCKTYEKMC